MGSSNQIVYPLVFQPPHLFFTPTKLEECCVKYDKSALGITLPSDEIMGRVRSRGARLSRSLDN